ncbi:MAG: hypothetical protein DMF80_05750 [Acidobacteria bacterium]|nr:MAG: hypothetical protein DMF80_05750 [Acidobacteriota bacterium]
MPLVEDAVLPVGALDDGTRHVSLRAALNCSSRLALRVALAATGLNPEWWPYRFGGAATPRVVKAPSSALGSGVRHFRDPIDEVAILERFAPELAQFGVVEQFVEGEQYEADGFVLDGRPTFFHSLRQTWRDDRIVAYDRCHPPARFHEAVAAALQATGLDEAPFCAELKHAFRRWIVIELHARLGEDAGLEEAMWDRSALEVIEAAAARVLPPRRRPPVVVHARGQDGG